MNAAIFHPSLPLCVTGGRTGIHVWTPTGEWVRGLADADMSWDDHIRELNFSPDGRFLLAKTEWDDDDKVWLWAFESEEHLGYIGGADLGNEICLFSPDGGRLLSVFHAQISLYGSLASSRATLWSLPEMRPLAILAGVGDVVTAAAFDSRSRFVATGHEDGKLRLWDAGTGDAIAALEGHESSIQAIASSPDGNMLASLCPDQFIVRRTFPTTEVGMEAIQRVIPRALTRSQRKRFFLSDSPPPWCIELEKWPFHTGEWKNWLAARHSGESAPMPAETDGD